MMEEEVYTLLSGAGFPVAWGPLPADAGLPRASIARVSGVREMNIDSLGPMESRVQIDCFGETYAEALQASRTIRNSLEGYAGGVIQGAFLTAIRDGFNDDADSVNRVSLTFVINYTE